MNPARRVENALEDQVLVNLVEDGFDCRAPFRDEPERLGLPPRALLLRSRRLRDPPLGHVGGLRERRDIEKDEDDGESAAITPRLSWPTSRAFHWPLGGKSFTASAMNFAGTTPAINRGSLDLYIR